MSLLLPVRTLAICGCLSFASLASFAETTLTPENSEFPIAGLLSGDQVKPQAALSSFGGYLVWEDNSVTTLGIRVRAIRLAADGHAIGSPFVLSSAAKSKTAGDQLNPKVALFPDGSAMIVWQGGGKKGIQQIYARVIDANGTVSKSDLRVGSSTKNNQIKPAVAIAADGTAFVVWSSLGQDGSRQGVYAQRFNADGGKLGKEFRVNQFVDNNQRDPAVAALANNGFAVAWISESQRSHSSLATSVDVYACIFDPTGIPGTEFLVNSSLAMNVCANPAVASSTQGGFAVVWSQNDNPVLPAGTIAGINSSRSTNSWDVFAAAFDPSGVAIGTQFRLNSFTYGDQYAPKISSAGSNYLSVWNSLGQDGSWEGVYGQLFSAEGDLQGGEFRVNTTTASRQIQPTVISDGVNHYLAIWSTIAVGTTFDLDLFAQKYLQTPGQ